MNFKTLLRSVSAFLLITQQIAPMSLNVYYAQSAYEQSSESVHLDNENQIVETFESVEEVEQPEFSASSSEEITLESLTEEASSILDESSESLEENLSRTNSEVKRVRLADLVTDVALNLVDESNKTGQQLNPVGETLKLDTMFRLCYTFKLPEGETLNKGDIILLDDLMMGNFPQGYGRFLNSDNDTTFAYMNPGKTEQTMYFDITGDTFYAEFTTSLKHSGVSLGSNLHFTTLGREFQVFAEEAGKAELVTHVWQEGKADDIPTEIVQLFNRSRGNEKLSPKQTYLNWVVEIIPQEPFITDPQISVDLTGDHYIGYKSVKFYDSGSDSFQDVYAHSASITTHKNQIGDRIANKSYLMFRTPAGNRDPDEIYRVTTVIRSQEEPILKTSQSFSIVSEDANATRKDIQADQFISDFSVWRDGAKVPKGGLLDEDRPIVMRYTLAIPDGVVLNEGDRLIVNLPRGISPQYLGKGIAIYDSLGNKVAEVTGKNGHEKLIFELTNYFAENEYQRFIEIDILAGIRRINGDKVVEFDYPNHKASYTVVYPTYEPLYNHLIEKYIAPPSYIPTSILPETIDLERESVESTHSDTELLFPFNSSLYRRTVEWVVYVNPESLNLGDITITDIIEEGHILQPQSISIRPYSYTSDITYNHARIVERDTGFDIKISDVKSAIVINYNTEVTDEGIMEFNNSITINTEFQGDASARATARFKSGGRASFKVKPVDLTIQAVKKLIGRELVADEFDFELLDSDSRQILATSSNDANGNVTFSNIRAAQEGTYHYIIRERAAQSLGVQYDEREFPISVVVRREGKELVVDSMTAPPTFTNHYRPLPTNYTIRAQKVLAGRALVDGEFTFELVPSDEGQAPLTATNNAQGEITFDPIQATQAGTYTYTLREQAGNQPSLTYDRTAHTVTVVVEDHNGQLAVTSMTEAPTFTNHYRPLPTNYTIRAQKVLAGRALVDGEFTFELVPSVDGQALLTATNNAQGEITFDPIQATQAGTYTYTLREQAGNQPSLTYDQTAHTVTVVVEDHNGQLAVTSMTEAPTFTNHYRPLPTNYTIRAQSILEGKSQEAGQFTFELWDDKGTKLGTATNDASGDVTFESILFTVAGERVFTIKEVIHPSPTITYLTEKEAVTLSIEDKDGQLVVKPIGKEVPVFYHKYKPLPVEHVLEAQVTTEGCLLIADGLKYELLDETGAILQTAKPTNHVVRFKPIRFEEEATKRYILRQVPETMNERMKYTKVRPEITLTVTDNGGQLSVSQKNSEPLTFVNVYQSQPITYSVVAKVTLADTETVPTFDFVLVNEQDKVIATAHNDSQGNIQFAPIEFVKEGKHHFEIRQVSGDKENIVYDQTTHKLTFEVGAEGCDWNLVSIPTAPVIFNNGWVPSQESAESSSSSSQPEPPQESAESSSESSQPEPPQESAESSSESSQPEPPQESTESSSESSQPEPPQESTESSSESGQPEPPQESTESSSESSQPEPPLSKHNLPKTGENPTILLWILGAVVGLAGIYVKLARKEN